MEGNFQSIAKLQAKFLNGARCLLTSKRIQALCGPTFSVVDADICKSIDRWMERHWAPRYRRDVFGWWPLSGRFWLSQMRLG